MKKVEILITDKDRFQIWTQDAFSEDFKFELDLYLFDTMVRQISVHQYTAFVIVNQEEHLYTLIEKMRKYTCQDVLYFCVTTLDGKTIVFHPTKVLPKGFIAEFLQRQEDDTDIPDERVTFEQLMEKYKDHMTPKMKAQLNAINLASSTCNKQRAEQQLKNIAPMLAGDNMIKNDAIRTMNVVHKGFDIYIGEVKYMPEDIVLLNDGTIVKLGQTTVLVEIPKGTLYFSVDGRDDIPQYNIERKATKEEVLIHNAPYKAGDWVVTYDGKLFEIDRVKVVGEIIHYKLKWGYPYTLFESQIKGKPTKGEILQHQHGLEKGDWVVAWDWVTPRTIAKFETFTDSGKYMLCQGHPISFTDFKKLPKDFDMNNNRIKL